MDAKRKYILYVEDMIDAIHRIMNYIDEMNYEAFISNQMVVVVVDAVVRNFEVLGEAAGNIPAEVQIKYPTIPWRQMKGLRNIVAHVYFKVNYETLWQIYSTQLSQNLEDLAHMLAIEKTE